MGLRVSRVLPQFNSGLSRSLRAMKELENVDRETRPTGNEVGLIWKPENTTTQVATNWKPIDLISLLEIKIYWNL